MKYTAVIRTLGKAGEKYQKMLDSLMAQTIAPEAILVYIAEGYALPAETVGVEKYIEVKKGMVAQRALDYKEVTTEYILFLDDDVYLPPNGVQKLYDSLRENGGDVISPDVFPNSERPFGAMLQMAIGGRMMARKDDGQWAYKVMRTCGYSYNQHPSRDVYQSESNAGPCFFCKKEDFLSIRFQEELWLDNCAYPIGEDQVMFYKMHLKGLKVLTLFNSGIEHLDAGINRTKEKENSLIYADFRFKTIFWHRFIWSPEENPLLRIWAVLCIAHAFGFSLAVSAVKLRFDIFSLKYSAIRNGIAFLRSEEYKQLPKI